MPWKVAPGGDCGKVAAMGDNGAMAVSSFLECGFPSTVNVKDLAAGAK